MDGREHLPKGYKTSPTTPINLLEEAQSLRVFQITLPCRMFAHSFAEFRMKNFCRVLRVALRNRFTLAGIIGCSLVVALLWGANIGMVYPLTEIISQGDSTHQLIDSRIEKTKTAVTDLRGDLAELRDTRADADCDTHAVDRQIAQLEGRLSAEEKALTTQQSIRPYVHQYLPDDPFYMLVTVITFLLIGTVAKNLALLANSILIARLGQATLLDMRREFFAKLLELDLALHGRSGSGRLIRRIMGA